MANLKALRQQIIGAIFSAYRLNCMQIQIIENSLKQKCSAELFLDHFAVIDLPGAHTGIPWLSKIFCGLGYVYRGRDYLQTKQNDFQWLAEADSEDQKATDVLPQVVIADFRLEALPGEIRTIIEKYSAQAAPAPLATIAELTERAEQGDVAAAQQLSRLIVNYLQGRDWPLPTKKEFQAVRSFNELLAWVLVFGRKPNHFTLSVHLLDEFSDLTEFNQFIERSTSLRLNREGSVIKGSAQTGIAQASTVGKPTILRLNDGAIEIPGDFVEFAWRYPLGKVEKPSLWRDYYPDFVGQNANYVIESLYRDK